MIFQNNMNIHKKFKIQIDLNYFHTDNSFAILGNIASPCGTYSVQGLYIFDWSVSYTETPISRTIYKTLFTDSFLIRANPTQIYSITFDFLKIKQFDFLLVFSFVPFVNWDIKGILQSDIRAIIVLEKTK